MTYLSNSLRSAGELLREDSENSHGPLIEITASGSRPPPPAREEEEVEARGDGRGGEG